MAFKSLEQRYNERVKSLYSGDTRKFENGRPSTGRNDDPLIVRRVGKGYWNFAEGRSTPFRSSFEDIKRLTLFNFSFRGVKFLVKQQLLQTGNTLQFTRILNPTFTIGNAVPFLHIKRNARPLRELFGRPDTNKAREWGQLQEETYNSVSSKGTAGSLFNKVKSKLLAPLKAVKSAVRSDRNVRGFGWDSSRPELGKSPNEYYVVSDQLNWKKYNTTEFVPAGVTGFDVNELKYIKNDFNRGSKTYLGNVRSEYQINASTRPEKSEYYFNQETVRTDKLSSEGNASSIKNLYENDENFKKLTEIRDVYLSPYLREAAQIKINDYNTFYSQTLRLRLTDLDNSIQANQSPRNDSLITGSHIANKGGYSLESYIEKNRYLTQKVEGQPYYGMEGYSDYNISYESLDYQTNTPTKIPNRSETYLLGGASTLQIVPYSLDDKLIDRQAIYNEALAKDIVDIAGGTSNYLKYFIPGDGTVHGPINSDSKNARDISKQSKSPKYLKDGLNLKQAPSSRLDLPYNDLKVAASNEDPSDPIVISIAMSNKAPVQFRAYIKDLQQSATPEYKTYQYIGRMERFINYLGVQREISFKLGIIAFSEDELQTVWKKINYITGLVYPYGYLSGIMQPNIVKLTIGRVFADQPGYFTSLNFNFGQITETWDIGSMAKVPISAEVDMKFTVIEKSSKTALSPFYGITEDMTDAFTTPPTQKPETANPPTNAPAQVPVEQKPAPAVPSTVPPKSAVTLPQVKVPADNTRVTPARQVQRPVRFGGGGGFSGGGGGSSF